MSEKKKQKAAAKITDDLKNSYDSVQMKFSEDKFYNDLTKPYFEKGKIYKVEGGDQIQRWLKRGGEIVSGELPLPARDEPSPSKIVANDSEKSDDAQTSNEDTGE